MALFTESVIRNAAFRKRGAQTAQARLRESVQFQERQDHFDVFLSHSIADAELVYGTKAILEDARLSVYVDWIEDPKLDRSHVTPATAAVLRRRMDQSDRLFYLHTEASKDSKWMPWELGYFDGVKGTVAIFPVMKSEGSTFKGQEYLGLYPYVDTGNLASPSGALYINKGASTHLPLNEWTRRTASQLRP